MVLQSVTRAVTRPMDRHLRRGCLVSESGLRLSLALLFLLVLTSRIESSLDTDELDGCHFSCDRWAQDQTDCVSFFVNSPSLSGRFYVPRLTMVLPVIVYGAILSFPEGVFTSKGWSLTSETQYSHKNDTLRFLRETSHLFCEFCVLKLHRIILF